MNPTRTLLSMVAVTLAFASVADAGGASSETDGGPLNESRTFSNRSSGDPEFGCDATIAHEDLPVGTTYGSGVGMDPEDLMFTESGIPVVAFTHSDGSNEQFGDAAIVENVGIGNGHAMLYSDMGGLYVFANLETGIEQVQFEFLDAGGVCNLSVNSEYVYVGPMTSLPSVLAEGITAEVDASSGGGSEFGTVTLTGDVQKLILSGKKLYVDGFCIDQGIAEPGICGPSVDFESRDLGESWGGPFGDWPNEVIFAEEGIDVAVATVYIEGDFPFGVASIDEPSCGQSTSQAMTLEEIAVVFDYSAHAPVTYARFDFCDHADYVYLEAGGMARFGSITDTPFDTFGPDVQFDVTITASDGNTISGYAEFAGESLPPSIKVGGELLQIDNFCIESEAPSSAPELNVAPALAIESYPNPFHLRTNLRLSLAEPGPVEIAVFDPTGRRVVTLLDQVLPAGSHQVAWEGRDGIGASLPAGIYLVRLRQREMTFSRKVALTR